jgi:CO dehydrogenase maturation factor
VIDKEPKYGLAVVGFVHPNHIATKAAAKAGDVLILTKPLGMGITATALKREMVKPDHVRAAVEVMKTLTFSKESEPREILLTREEIRDADLPGDYIVERDGIGLVCIGKILQSLEGCACPMGALSREFLKRLSLQKDEMAVVDMEAGIEHFGRGVETSIDSVLIVTEPSFDSLELAEKINSLAAEVGVERVWTILNKIGSKEIASRLREELEEKGISVIGSIGYEPEIFQSGLEGRPVRRDRMKTDIGRILDQLL